ncbi:hypothetical protein ACOAKC_01140 [Hathewaya histolytica]|uniref:hypothetical protein n=1 Tax=Hathewaya histolytica TaxID=1498 RepID=UPI003B67DF21
MSIRRNFKKVALLELKKIQQQPSGAWKKEWIEVKKISVGIFPLTGVYLSSSNVKFVDSTNTGLTTYRGLKEGLHRLNDGSEYEIQWVNETGRLTQLVLKKVVADV